MRKFTIAEVADAIAKNGYKQSFGQLLVRNYDGEVVEACAIGQAALNLDVDANLLDVALAKVKPPVDGSRSLRGTIVDLNDGNEDSLDTIAETIRDLYQDRLDEIVVIY